MEVVDLQLTNPDNAYQAQYEGPGSTNDRSIDLGSLDPLVQLGLVDPKTGSALPTDDWQPPQANTNSQGAPAQTTQAPNPVAGSGSQSAAAPAGATVQSPAPAPAGPSADQQYQYRLSVLQAQAEAAYQQMVSGGTDAAVARQVIDAKLEAEAAKALLAARSDAMLPTAKSQVAQLIATRQGAGQVRPEELLVYDTPQAMEAAASQLANARRASNYQDRTAQGRDRAEGQQPGRGISAAISELSPEKKIELGIRRGQYS
jgi:hypothetical protein